MLVHDAALEVCAPTRPSARPSCHGARATAPSRSRLAARRCPLPLSWTWWQRARALKKSQESVSSRCRGRATRSAPSSRPTACGARPRRAPLQLRRHRRRVRCGGHPGAAFRTFARRASKRNGGAWPRGHVTAPWSLARPPVRLRRRSRRAAGDAVGRPDPSIARRPGLALAATRAGLCREVSPTRCVCLLRRHAGHSSSCRWPTRRSDSRRPGRRSSRWAGSVSSR